jgi:hypothetical protein
LLSFNPLAFTHVPPDVTTSKLCGDSIFGNSVWQCVYKIKVYSVKKLETFGYVVDVFLPRKFKLISEKFKLVSQRTYSPFVFRPIVRGKVLKVSSWRGRVKVQRGVFWREVGWCLAETVVSRAETDVWLLKTTPI